MRNGTYRCRCSPVNFLTTILQASGAAFCFTAGLKKPARSDKLKAVVCASADKFVDEPDKKRFLNRSFGAHICDMETAGVVITAARAGVPCLIIKTVSDGVESGAAEFEKELGRASAICIDIADKIVRETLK